MRLERGRASRQEQHANDLEKTVENIKSKICQLEDETIAKVCQQQNQVKELQKDQHVSQVTLIRYLGIETADGFAWFHEILGNICSDQNNTRACAIKLLFYIYDFNKQQIFQQIGFE